MHTFEGKSIRIFHHGDYLGNGSIIDKNTGTEIKVDMEDLLNYVAEYIRSKRISEIEQMGFKELLR